MTRTTCYRVAGPHIAAKKMDGELVVINLRNGLYYASDSIGGDIWQGFEDGASEAGIAQRIASAFDVSAEQAEADIAAFAAKLVAESLIEPAGTVEAVEPVAPAGERPPYAAPSLTTFDDMAETFALDPPLKI